MMISTSPRRVSLRSQLLALVALHAGAAQVYAQSYARELPGVERTLVIRTASDATWVGRGRLAVRGREWLYAYVRGNHHGGTDVTKRIHVRFSTDEGRTWTASDTLPSGQKATGLPLGPIEEKVEAGELDLIECPSGDLLILVREMVAVPPTKGIGRPGKGMRQFRSTDGGKSWRDEGKPMSAAVGGGDYRSSLDHCIIGRDIYTLMIVPAGGPKNAVQLLKSTDNGHTWTRVSIINPGQEPIQETGLAHLGGTKLMAVGRTVAENATLLSTSDDLGRTWKPWTDISPQVGVTQQPNLVMLGDKPGRLYLVGRLRTKETVQRNGIWWTDDAGRTWRGGVLDEKDFVDTGYGDMRRRSDGAFVYVAYRGKDDLSNVYTYVFRVKE
ncbi:MAG: sialidase family protein [Opitutaceae bacterium]|nr:sialidase family protein [Opitutaceae bacterium]